MNSVNGMDSQFQEILTAAKERRGDLNVDTMIVSSHLAQMRMFMLRRGVEFYASQDSFGTRRQFLASVIEENQLEMKLESIIDYFLCDGQGLFYFRPAKDSYQLMFFPQEQYRAYRNQDGELSSVTITYSFSVNEPNNFDQYATQDGKGGKKKYIQLKVYKDRIEQLVSNEKIEFENDNGGFTMGQQGESSVVTNSLGFIPAVEIFNHMDCTGESSGNGEFDWIANQILFHDELVKNVRKNIRFFGNPTLVSSRPKHDLIESGDENSFRPTISSQAGFSSMMRPSTRVSQPFGSPSALDGQIKVPRVIANVEPTDRISYMTPDAVSGDQNLYVKQYRSEIRLALGGVDDIDIGTAGTAYEIKTLYGRVASTAEKKCRALFTFGLCRLFSLMIQNEEELFRNSFAVAIGLQEPVIPLPEEFEGDEEAFAAAMEKYNKQMTKFVETRDLEMRARLDSGELPPGITGLIPDGSTKVAWRWTGQVFEEQTDDILNQSIVVRNLQELGVDSIEALKYLFPSKTDEERAAMLTGYPFRMVKETQASVSNFIGLLSNLYQLPHPQTPDIPLAADPNLDITGFLYRSLDFLRKELSYSGKYSTSGDDPTTSKLSAADERRAAGGRPIRDEPVPDLPGLRGPGTSGHAGPGGVPAAGGPAGFGPNGGRPPGTGPGGQPMAGSVSGSQRQLEYKQPLPSPGSILGLPDTNSAGSYTGQLQFNGAFGSPDIQSPSFNPPSPPTAGGTGRKSGPVSKRNQRRKS